SGIGRARRRVVAGFLGSVERGELELIDEAQHARVLGFHAIALAAAQAVRGLAKRIEGRRSEGVLRQAIEQGAQTPPDFLGLLIDLEAFAGSQSVRCERRIPRTERPTVVPRGVTAAPIVAAPRPAAPGATAVRQI